MLSVAAAKDMEPSINEAAKNATIGISLVFTIKTPFFVFVEALLRQANFD